MLRSILQRDPKNTKVLDLKAAGEYKSGELEMAQETWESIAKNQSDQIDIWKKLATVYSKLKLHRELELACQIIIDSEPTSAQWHYDHANALLRQNKPGQAIPAYERCLKLNPNHCMATINLASALIEAGRFAESRKQFTRAQKLDANDNRWSSNITRGINRLDRVQRMASQVLLVEDGDFETDDETARLEFANVSQLIGRHRTALSIYQELINESDNRNLASILGLNYRAARSAAALSFRRLASNSPDDRRAGTELDELAFSLIKSEFTDRQSLAQSTDTQNFRRQYALLLQSWQTDPLLKHVREERINSLESAAALRWQSFWNEVQDSIEQNW